MKKGTWGVCNQLSTWSSISLACLPTEIASRNFLSCIKSKNRRQVGYLIKRAYSGCFQYYKVLLIFFIWKYWKKVYLFYHFFKNCPQIFQPTKKKWNTNLEVFHIINEFLFFEISVLRKEAYIVRVGEALHKFEFGDEPRLFRVLLLRLLLLWRLCHITMHIIVWRSLFLTILCPYRQSRFRKPFLGYKNH